MPQIEKHQKLEDELQTSTRQNVIKDKKDDMQLKFVDEINTVTNI